MAQAAAPGIATEEKPEPRNGQTLRDQCMQLHTSLKLERSGWEPDWRDIADYIDPWSLRFHVSERNRGVRKGQKIINGIAMTARRTLAAGMTAGMTSPARPWLKLTTPDPEMAEYGPVREWLQVVTSRMLTVMLRSNLYQALPQVYAQEGTFGTGCVMLQEDSEDLFRCYVQPPGMYSLGVDSRLLVNVFAREFRWTVRQIVETFVMGKGATASSPEWWRVSPQVKNAWDMNRMDQTADILHIIRPNPDYDPRYENGKRKRFQSAYIEMGAPAESYLRVSGYSMFPVLAPRWDVVGDDSYGVGPGHVARGDVKALQLLERRKSQAIEKMVNPPLTGPSELRREKVSLLPGDITYQDVTDPKVGLRPLHEVQMRIDTVGAEISQHETRINSAFYADLFLMLAMSDRREITAREVEERHEEKLLMLGPTIERQNQDLLNPLVDLVFALMESNGLLPPPPQELAGVQLRVEFLGLLAQAQKLVGTVAIERTAAFVAGLAQAFPDAADKFDADQAIDAFGDAQGVPPDIIRSDDDVLKIRDERAQQQAAAAQAQAAMLRIQGAQALGSIDMSKDTALIRMTEAAPA